MMRAPHVEISLVIVNLAFLTFNLFQVVGYYIPLFLHELGFLCSFRGEYIT